MFPVPPFNKRRTVLNFFIESSLCKSYTTFQLFCHLSACLIHFTGTGFGTVFRLLAGKEIPEFIPVNNGKVDCQAGNGYPGFGGKKPPFRHQFKGNIFCPAHKRPLFAARRQQDEENLIKAVKNLHSKVDDDKRVEYQPACFFKVEFCLF